MIVHSLRRDTVVFGVATVFEKLLIFVVLPMLAKRLPVELYGVWTQIVATTGLLSVIVLMGMDTAAVRILGAWSDEEHCASTFNSMLSLICCSSVLVALLCVGFAPAISKLMFGSTAYHEYAVLFGILVCTETIYIQLLSLFQARREMVRFSVMNIVRNGGRYSVLGTGILLAGLDLTLTLKWLASFQIAVILVIYVCFVLPITGVKFRLRLTPWRRIWQFALPLAAAGVLTWLGGAINRYFLLHFFSLREVSVYALNFTLGSITGVCWAILSPTVYPHLNMSWQRHDQNRAAEIMSNTLDYYIFFALPCIGVIALLDRPIIRLVATNDYTVGPPLLGLVSISVALLGVYHLNVYGILLAEKSRLVLLMAGTWSAGSILLNLLLIPKLGLIGAPLAALIANAVLAFVGVRQCRLVLRYPIRWFSMCKSAVTTLVMCMVLGFATYFFPAENLMRLAQLLGLGVAIYASLDLMRKDSVLVRLGFPL